MAKLSIPRNERKAKSATEIAYIKTVIQVEVLSEDDFNYETLKDVHNAITYDNCSGKITTISKDEVTPKEMAKLLKQQGSDTEFFRLDEEGNDLDEHYASPLDSQG